MLKEMFEQFIYSQDTCFCSVRGSERTTAYTYGDIKTGIKMTVIINTPFLYEPKLMQDMVHKLVLEVLEVKFGSTQV